VAAGLGNCWRTRDSPPGPSSRVRLIVIDLIHRRNFGLGGLSQRAVPST
jgi:hypothetical protein